MKKRDKVSKGRKKINRNIILIVVLVLVVLFGVMYFFGDGLFENVSLSPRGMLKSDSGSVLSAQDIEKIAIVKEEIGKGGQHPDYSSLYDLLETKKGKLDETIEVCKEFDPFFCLKGASSRNPELRDGICAELSSRIVDQYGDRLSSEKLNRVIEGAEEDCSLGLPQFMY